MKKTWNTIKKFWPYLKKTTNTAGLKHDVNETDMAEQFNDFFSSVGQNLADKIPESIDSPTDFQARAPIFDLELFSLDNIVEYMKALTPSTSCGVDGITARLLYSYLFVI